MPLSSLVLRLEVEQVEPCIWRVVRVPGALALSDLHRVLQTVMSWEDGHPHAFEIPARPPRRPADICGCARPLSDEAQTVASALASSHDRFSYVYKAGGGWRVRITRARGVWTKSRTPIACVDGYLAGPRVDCGDPAGYTAVLAATLGRGPRLTRDALDQLGPGFDPERFDRSAVNRALSRLALVEA